jgi:predicted ATPase
MPEHVTEIRAVGVHGRFDLRLRFHPDVNIVFGRNGTGKTTMLHLLSNILEGDYWRFAFLAFRSVTVGLGDAGTVVVTRAQEPGDESIRVTLNGQLIQEFSAVEAREYRSRAARVEAAKGWEERTFKETDRPALPKAEPLIRTAYFPAFRTMIEAWAAMEERVRWARHDRWREEAAGWGRGDRWREEATGRARYWFGPFVPSVSFPSLLEIEDRLAGEIASARLKVSREDRRLLSQAFLDIFEALSEGGEEVGQHAEPLLAEIGQLFDRLRESPLKAESMILTEVYSQLRELITKFRVGEEPETTAVRVLNVYREMLARIVDVQEGSFAETERYLTSVNEFLEEKDLVIDPEPGRYRGAAVGVKFPDGSYARGLRALSSGERQIVTLIYAATHMSKQQVVLIDEPEISLHVDWQRMLIPKMADQLGERQIIACTHSPVIGADYEDRVLELQLTPTAEPVVEEEAQEEEDVT